MYYAINTPSIDIDKDTKAAMVIQALWQSMGTEIDLLKREKSVINIRLKTVNHDKSLYRSAKIKINERLNYIKGERKKLATDTTFFTSPSQRQTYSKLYEITESETLDEFETRIIESIENSLRIPQNIYNEKGKVAQSQWKNLINRVIADFSFSQVDVLPDIPLENKHAMLTFFTALSLEIERVNNVNAAKSINTEELLNEILFTLQRFIDCQVWTLDIINYYRGSPRPTYNIFDTYTILSIASFQSMGPFETLYSQKNKPDIFRIFPTEEVFSKVIFNHAYKSHGTDTNLKIREYQPYFSAFTQVEVDLNRFNLDELVKSYEISAFFNDVNGKTEGNINFYALTALSYLYEKFPFELTRSKTEEEISIEINIVRYFEGLKASSSNMQLSATDTLAVTGSSVEVSLLALIEGDIPSFIVDKIKQPDNISDKVWETILSGELYQNMQEEVQLQTQRVEDIDEYMKKTEEIIQSIQSPEKYIRQNITKYSSLNPEQRFNVSIINRPPDRLRGNLREREKFLREPPPTIKNFTVYEIITGKADHALNHYRLTDLIIDWEESSELAYIAQHRDWIINGYDDYIDNIDSTRLDNYFTILHQISGDDKLDINAHLEELKTLLDESTYTTVELDINFGLEVIKQMSSVLDYAFPVSGIKSYLLSLGLQVGTSLLQAENASTNIEKKLYLKEALNNFIYSTVMSTLTISKSVSPMGIKGMKYLKLGAAKLNKSGGYFINTANQSINFMSASIKTGKSSFFRYNVKKLQNFNHQIDIPMTPIKLPIVSLTQGDISPLRAKGGLNLRPSESKPIDIEFDAVRIDNQFNTGMV
jgi:hypothetical protein